MASSVNIVTKHICWRVYLKERLCLSVPLVCNLGCQKAFGFKGRDMGSDCIDL